MVQSPLVKSAEEPGSPEDTRLERSLLQKVQHETQAALGELDKNLAKASKELAQTGLSSKGGRAVLAGTCKASKEPFVVDCCTVDAKGRILAIEPPVFKNSEGADISGQEQVVRLHATKQPVMSQTIAMVEGFEAVDIQRPVLSKSGDLLGSVSILIKPELLLAGIIESSLKGAPVDIWVMEKDGRLLYDTNQNEIGKNLFSDALYTKFDELQKLGRRISDEPSGEGSYAFYEQGTNAVVSKHALWSSVGLHGTQWRVVMVQKVAENHAEKPDARALPRISSLVKSLCESVELQNALALGDEAEAMSIFKEFFHHDTLGLYSIQWVDASGKNRFGYPPENSLKNYSFKEGKSPGDEKFMAAVKARKEATFVLPLLEGGSGSFYLYPVYWGDRYLGMIYAIEREAGKTK